MNAAQPNRAEGLAVSTRTVRRPTRRPPGKEGVGGKPDGPMIEIAPVHFIAGVPAQRIMRAHLSYWAAHGSIGSL